MATHSSILAWRIPMDRGDWQGAVHGGCETRSLMTLETSLQWQPILELCSPRPQWVIHKLENNYITEVFPQE